MKRLLFIPSCLALLALTACEITGEGGDPNNTGFGSKPTPAFSEQNLAGKVFGQDWQAKKQLLFAPSARMARNFH